MPLRKEEDGQEQERVNSGAWANFGFLLGVLVLRGRCMEEAKQPKQAGSFVYKCTKIMGGQQGRLEFEAA